MAKKIVIGALVAVLVGSLTVAALDLSRGSASADSGEHHGRSAEQGERRQGATAGGQYGEGRQGAGGQGNGGQRQDSFGRGQLGESLSDQGARAGQGWGAGREGHEISPSQPSPQASVREWLTYQGTVTAIDDAGVTMVTDSGEEMSLKLGPSWFSETQGFALEVGDEITATGFYDAEMFEAAQITRLADGQSLVLRSEDGRPVWAGGRGQRGRN